MAAALLAVLDGSGPPVLPDGRRGLDAPASMSVPVIRPARGNRGKRGRIRKI